MALMQHPILFILALIVFLIIGGFSIFGITLIDSNKIRDFIQKFYTKRTAKKTFGEIRNDLREISNQLKTENFSKDSWKSLQTTINSDLFFKRINALNKKKLIDGEKISRTIRELSTKDKLEKQDALSLNYLENEFNLLDRFLGEIESTNRRNLLKISSISIVSGAAGALATISLINDNKNNPEVSVSAGALNDKPEQPVTTWKYKSIFQNKDGYNFILNNAMNNLCELVAQMSEGKFIIEPFRTDDDTPREISSEIILDSIHTRKVDCGVAGIYYSDQKKGLIFGTGIPFGFNPEEQTAWLENKVKPAEYEKWRKFMEDRKINILPDDHRPTSMEYIYNKIYKLNVIPIPLIATGPQMGGFFRKTIESPVDLSEIIMRIPGIGGEVLKKLNSNFKTENISPNEIANSINAKRRINAFEFTGPSDDKKIFDQINDKSNFIYHYPGWWEPGTTFELQINRHSWNGLNEPFRHILRAACAQIYKETLAKYDIENSNTLRKMNEERSVKFHKFSTEFLHAAKDATDKFLHDNDHIIKTQSSDFEEAFKIWNDFRNTINQWSNLNLVNQYQRIEEKENQTTKR